MATDGSSNNNNGNSAKQDRLREAFQSLHQEMEIAEYGKTHNGQFRKKLPKELSVARTKKRKLLEASDAKHSAVSVEEATEPRLRGSRIALEDEIIQGSAIYPDMPSIPDKDLLPEDDEDDQEDFDDETDESDEGEQDDGSDAEQQQTQQLQQHIQQQRQQQLQQPGVTKPALVPKPNTVPKRKRRLIFRMRNFKSHRMAQRHGDALGAHARGLPREAIRKLEQVAADAPNAPQVYSSLGMVYEDLMATHRMTTGGNEEMDDESFEEQLRLAKKAYGSYHAAAVLCKKDFTLWVRAGDTAIGIVSLLNEAMQYSRNDDGPRMLHLRSEKNRWLEDAKRDYTAADNLKPPGIDIPAKLADVQVQLCNLSEALTLLTDLKNREGPKQQEGEAILFQPRSDFERSYKAWLLYSDLMLRIGHESTQWNRGIRTNENYMFKRWLRKYSTNFDWQERRLQSLTLALEAAAGSHVCTELIEWSRNRAKMYTESVDATESGRWHGDLSKEPPADVTKVTDESALDGDEDMDQEDADAEEHEGDSELILDAEPEDTAGKRPTTSHRQSEFDTKRAALIATNRAELEEFDRKTYELGFMDGSVEQQHRASDRDVLVKNHRSAVVAMVSQHLTDMVPRDDANEPTSLKQPLPISASCSTVCAIASELMKHCLGLEEFEGARLVGNATSLYLQCRANMHRDRQASIVAFTSRQQSTDNAVLLNLEAYDGVAEDSADESDSDIGVSYLSDEDMIEGEIGDTVLKFMQAGFLPSELQVLYAMALIGEGGRDYAASKALMAITTLVDSSSETVDTDVIQSKPWQIFRRASTDPLRRIPAFAFVADLLKKTGKESDWSDKLSGLFHDQVERMRECGQLAASFEEATPADTAQLALRRQQVLKIVLSAARLNLHNTKRLLVAGGLEEAASRSLMLLDQLLLILKALWKVHGDGSVPTPCIEILSLASASFATLKPWLQIDAPTRFVDMYRAAERLSSILTIVLGRGMPVPIAAHNDATHTLQQLTVLPITSNWQTEDEREMSIRAYNLVVACCVTSFSGHEREEFNLNLLKRNPGGSSYFGISMHEGRVSGPINSDIEMKLQQLWMNLCQHIPFVASLDLARSLEIAKESTWFDTTGPHQDLVARYGESCVLLLLLEYSDLCVSLAAAADRGNEETFRLALSTALPLLQFCLGKSIWDSDIGKTITSLSSSSQAKKKTTGFASIDFSSLETSFAYDVDGELTLSSKAKLNPSMRIRDQWLADLSSRDSLMKILRIPAAVFLVEWEKDATPRPTNDSVASEAMQKVETCMQSLRQCCSMAAAQKASLQVSIALLDLVATGAAFNPFACLQQAAMYASLSPKGGNNDVAFKTVLPESCTALEALVIAGRADCLQALHFPMEAIFLCNYVGRVCLGHRDKLTEDMEWNHQWKMLSIYVYNTTMLLRSTVVALLPTRESQQKALNGWDDDVLAELERARLDGVALKKTLFKEDERIIAESSESEEDNDHYLDEHESVVVGGGNDGVGGVDPLSQFSYEPEHSAAFAADVDEEGMDEIYDGTETGKFEIDDASMDENGEIVAV